MNKTKSRKPDLSGLAVWPSPWVARKNVEDFSGGAVSSKTLANADYEGRGPKGRIRLNGNIIYPVKSLIEWLESRAMVLD